MCELRQSFTAHNSCNIYIDFRFYEQVYFVCVSVCLNATLEIFAGTLFKALQLTQCVFLGPAEFNHL